LVVTTAAAIAGLLSLGCVVPYLRDILSGSTRPQRTSWIVFSAVSWLAAAAQISLRATVGSFLALGAAIGFTSVAVLSVRRGVGGTHVADWLALGAAAVGLAGWIVFRRPLAALLGTIVAEAAAASLTIGKALRDPQTETALTWFMDGAAGLIAVAACDRSAIALAYPVHHTVLNGLVFAAITVGRLRASSQGSRA
jgi:hypothetical protein